MHNYVGSPPARQTFLAVKQKLIKILLIEDSDVFADRFRELLAEPPSGGFSIIHTKRLSEALPLLSEETFDAVILDLNLPDALELSTYARIKTYAPSVPVIVLTGLAEEELGLEAVKQGAQDHLVKSHLSARLVCRVIRYAIERKRSETVLRRSEEFLRFISDHVEDLIAIVDTKGRRLFNSASYQQLLGDPGALLGTDSFEEIHPEDRQRIRELFQDTVRSGLGHRAEYRMVLKDGTVRYIESQGDPIRDDKGKTTRVVVVSRDITERKTALEKLRQSLGQLKKTHEQLKVTQTQLVQTEKLEALSDFAAGVAREVRNPLQAIILGIDFLSNYSKVAGESGAMVLTEMDNAVQRADAIIDGLLEFSACNKGQTKEKDLNNIVHQALDALESELAGQHVELRQDLASNLPALELDSKPIKQVFLHLFRNLLQNLPAGVRLTVRTYSREMAAGHGLPRLKAGDKVVVAEVHRPTAGDRKTRALGKRLLTGSGSKAAAHNVGLSLVVLRKIVELYGGAVEITEQIGDGYRLGILFKVPGQRSP
jgi:PAS domain S-box-containing protein